MERPYKVYEFAFNALLFFWLMTLLPSESQQPDGRLSLVWTMVYALAAAFAFGFFNDVVVGRWHPGPRRESWPPGISARDLTAARRVSWQWPIVLRWPSLEAKAYSRISRRGLYAGGL